jgi:hypothetical protein
MKTLIQILNQKLLNKNHNPNPKSIALKLKTLIQSLKIKTLIQALNLKP